MVNATMTDEGKDTPQIFHFSLLAGERRELDAFLEHAYSTEDAARRERAKKKKPGRYKGKLEIGPEFFEPLSDDEIKELTGE
ncbi:hypothetical protein [Rhizobium binxianense]